MKLARARVAAAARRAGARGDGSPPRKGRVSCNPPRSEGGPQSVVCGLCGRTFAPYGGASQVYCKRCTAKIDREIRREMAVDCRASGKAFATASRAVRCRSGECGAEGRCRSERESARRRKADPERRAARAAYARANAFIGPAKGLNGRPVLDGGRGRGECGGRARRMARMRARRHLADTDLLAALNRGRLCARRCRAARPAGRLCARARPARRLANLITPSLLRGAMARPTECRACGRSLAQHGDPRHLYCRRCMAKADREAAQTPRVECRECGKRFSTRTRTVKYCSDACRAAGKRRIGVEGQRRYMADPEKRAMALVRSRMAAAAGRAGAQGGRQPRAGRNATGPESVACRLCGRAFAPYGGAHHVHCKTCDARLDREIGRAIALDCKECGKRFSTKSRVVRYCSKECSAVARRRGVVESARRSMADPGKHAMVLARIHAQNAAKRDREGR